MLVLCGAGMPQINVLLSILWIESNAVHGFAYMRRAGHTCVFIGNVKAAQIACILIGKVFDYVGVRLPDICAGGTLEGPGGTPYPIVG
jgi:hypothetical protein